MDSAGISEHDAAGIAKLRVYVQAWNRDSKAWLDKLNSKDADPMVLEAQLTLMEMDVRNFEKSTSGIEDPSLRALMTRLARAYTNEYRAYKAETDAIADGNVKAVRAAVDSLIAANERQQAAASAFLNFIQAKNASGE